MEQWQIELQKAITTSEELDRVLKLSPIEIEGVVTATKHFRMKITNHILSLIDPDDPHDPIKQQYIPSIKETYIEPAQYEDVNRDDEYSPVKGVVHKYPTKALLFPSNYCGSFCRFCFRRRFVGEQDTNLSDADIQNALTYIRSTHNLEEIILSGGDPLTLSDDKLEWLISEISGINHIKIIRVHTRMPINCPSRITEELVLTLKKYQPIYFVVHINHPKEISSPTRDAFRLLVDNGIPCLSQTALLHGVNDNEEILRELWTTLICNRVKPYYLFHSDPVIGLGHFSVPIPRGIEIMKNLYDRMSGLAYPLYCFNVPGGYGHILLGHNYIKRVGVGHYRVETFDNQVVEIKYPEKE